MTLTHPSPSLPPLSPPPPPPRTRRKLCASSIYVLQAPQLSSSSSSFSPSIATHLPLLLPPHPAVLAFPSSSFSKRRASRRNCSQIRKISILILILRSLPERFARGLVTDDINNDSEWIIRQLTSFIIRVLFP